MTPDPEHLADVELTHHAIECRSAVPYERCGEKHRKKHKTFAHELLNGLHNRGWTLTRISGRSE